MLNLNLTKTDSSQEERLKKRQELLLQNFQSFSNTESSNKQKTRQNLLHSTNENDFSELFDVHKLNVDQVGQKNCENFVGSVEIPVGVAGSTSATMIFNQDKTVQHKQILIPLATTEGALVASVSRGMKLLRQAKDFKVYVKKIGMTRAPVFGFSSHHEAIEFIKWLDQSSNFKKIKFECEKTSQHLKLLECQSWPVGRVVYVRFVFDTDQAMGMNMVTIALGLVWQKVLAQYPGISMISLSGNMCADKKTTALNRILGRGYRVQAEAVIGLQDLQQVLKVEMSKLLKTYYWKNVIGSNMSGSSSINMHAGNMVAALFLATGQDMAHAIDSSQADLLMEKNDDGSLYVAVFMPNVNVGVVGGGTSLKPFVQARRLILGRDITSEELAGALAIAVLAGELSGLAALATQTLACAHQTLARGNF